MTGTEEFQSHQTGDLHGRQVGAYTLESPLGAGGMGTVWLAHRSDGRYEGRVAVKLLNAAMIGRPAEQRFVREGSVLARLRHPNIAQLSDAGIAPGGQPYLVLEYVEGERIDLYAARARLGIDARVELFLDVIAAVSQAHSQLVVHRDLKPSNILVTKTGNVKLLDFGVAALLGDGEAEATRELGSMLTPEYAAPEQLLGQQVTTATDVYALGLVLFVLLVGQHPYAKEGMPASILARATLEDDIPSLSAVSGDLGNIVAKALKKNPAERYASADALAQDLRRYLAHQPVSARPDSLAYRASRFVRRNRGAVAAGATMSLVLIAAAVMTTVHMVEAKRQRDEAVSQSKRAENQSRFAYQILSETGGDGRPITIRDVMGKGVEVLERNYGQDPEFAIGALINISGRYMDVGDTQGEHAALVKAETLARQVGDPDLIATVQCNTVETELALGEPQRANERMRDGLLNLKKLRNPDPVRQVECGLAHARLLWSQDDLDGAIEEATKVGELMERNRLLTHVSYRTVASMTIVMLNEADRSREAVSWVKRYIEVLEQTGADQTMQMGNALHNRAGIFYFSGDVRSAFEVAHDSVARIEKQAGREVLAPQQMFWLALYQARAEESDAALVWADRGVIAAQKSGYRGAQVGALIARAQVRLSLHQLDRVIADVVAAEAIANEDPDANRSALRMATLTRGEWQLARGDASTALATADALLADIGYPQRTAQRVVAALNLRARAELATRSERATAAAYEALAAAEARALDSAHSADVGVALMTLAQAVGDRDEATVFARQAAFVLARSLGPNHSETRAALSF